MRPILRTRSLITSSKRKHSTLKQLNSHEMHEKSTVKSLCRVRDKSGADATCSAAKKPKLAAKCRSLNSHYSVSLWMNCGGGFENKICGISASKIEWTCRICIWHGMNSIPRAAGIYSAPQISTAEIKSNKEMLRAVFFSIMNTYRIECEKTSENCLLVVLTRRFHQYMQTSWARPTKEPNVYDVI